MQNGLKHHNIMVFKDYIGFTNTFFFEMTIVPTA